MRKLCPNYDREDGLDTVLEVPIPEEMFTNMGCNAALRWQNLSDLMKARGVSDKTSAAGAGSNSEFLSLLKLVGSPLIPFQVPSDYARALTRPIQDSSIEASSAKYIVQQYIAAAGGHEALDSVKSMVVMGQVKMLGTEVHNGNDNVGTNGEGEVGGFVLWAKDPDLWDLELVVSGYKVRAGSNGKIAWNQSSSQPYRSNKSSPRPLRRFFQGLDPRSIANLFLEAVCIGEKNIIGDPCFTLKIETNANTLKAHSTANTEIVHHTIWGYFSQRTGLLLQFSDTKLVRIKSPTGDDNVFWETTMDSLIDDYKNIEGINIGHSGKTSVLLYRYGQSYNHKQKIEETWRIEEIDFNVSGLSMDCFLPPADLQKDKDGGQH